MLLACYPLITPRNRCVLSAVIGMASVTWYALGERLSDAEVEAETKRRQAAKDARGRFFGAGKVLGKLKH